MKSKFTTLVSKVALCLCILSNVSCEKVQAANPTNPVDPYLEWANEFTDTDVLQFDIPRANVPGIQEYNIPNGLMGLGADVLLMVAREIPSIQGVQNLFGLCRTSAAIINHQYISWATKYAWLGTSIQAYNPAITQHPDFLNVFHKWVEEYPNRINLLRK